MAVVRFDFRAHGLSGGTNEDIRLATMRADVEAILQHVDEQFGSKTPIIPIGLSFGGGAAVHAAAARHPCLGVVLWYPVIDYEWNFGRSSKLPFTHEMRESKSTQDPPWSEMPVRGTSMHFPVELVSEFRDDATPSTLSHLRVPVLVYHGARDRMVDPGPIRRLSDSNRNMELRLVPGAGHGFRLWQPWVAYRTVSWCVRIAS
jgi:pimeloyl-ACP methyl ester carboxylesterase